MEAGQRVYRAYNAGNWTVDDRPFELICEGTLIEVVRNGQSILGVEREYGEMIQPLTKEWHARRCDALRDHHRDLVRFIGYWQSQADELAARILHADLMTEEVTDGVA